MPRMSARDMQGRSTPLMFTSPKKALLPWPGTVWAWRMGMISSNRAVRRASHSWPMRKTSTDVAASSRAGFSPARMRVHSWA